MNDAKSIFTSKLFWFNIVVGIADTIDYVTGHGWIPEWALPIVSMCNIGLRAVTSQAVTFWPSKS